MTHTQDSDGPVRVYPADVTNTWLDTITAREAFRSWIVDRADHPARCRAHLALIGWAPLRDFAQTNYWIAQLDTDAPAFRHLWAALSHLWIGTPDEHARFHMWADPNHGVGTLCSGCWL